MHAAGRCPGRPAGERRSEQGTRAFIVSNGCAASLDADPWLVGFSGYSLVLLGNVEGVGESGAAPSGRPYLRWYFALMCSLPSLSR